METKKISQSYVVGGNRGHEDCGLKLLLEYPLYIQGSDWKQDKQSYPEHLVEDRFHVKDLPAQVTSLLESVQLRESEGVKHRQHASAQLACTEVSDFSEDNTSQCLIRSHLHPNKPDKQALDLAARSEPYYSSSWRYVKDELEHTGIEEEEGIQEEVFSTAKDYYVANPSQYHRMSSPSFQGLNRNVSPESVGVEKLSSYENVTPGEESPSLQELSTNSSGAKGAIDGSPKACPDNSESISLRERAWWMEAGILERAVVVVAYFIGACFGVVEEICHSFLCPLLSPAFRMSRRILFHQAGQISQGQRRNT